MDSVIPSHIADSTEPVALFGFATPKPGRAQELERTLRSFVQPTRAEDGAIAYELHRDPQRPGVLAFYEHWATGAHLRRHLQQPQMQNFLAGRAELLDGDLDIRFFTPLTERVGGATVEVPVRRRRARIGLTTRGASARRR